MFTLASAAGFHQPRLSLGFAERYSILLRLSLRL